MKILSQNKQSLFNFNNISCIYIYPPKGEEDCCYSLEILYASGDGGAIGMFTTKQQAEDVLYEILECTYSTYAVPESWV